MEILINLFYQLVFTVGIIIGFGILIALCRKAFCIICGRAGRTILLVTGIVGTPIHELSHALMCIIFGHKITEIKLFSPTAKNGMLGYVNHTYNPKNLYHRIGNFFIGTAPVIFGSGAIILLTYLLVPSVFEDIISSLDFSNGSTDAALSLSNVKNVFFAIFGAIFAAENLSNPLWWVFIILALMISSHMELSPQDIKSGLYGFVFIALTMLCIDVALYFIDAQALTATTMAVTSFSIYVIAFLGISLVFSILLVALAALIKLFF